jgi:hypothetical protein
MAMGADIVELLAIGSRAHPAVPAEVVRQVALVVEAGPVVTDIGRSLIDSRSQAAINRTAIDSCAVCPEVLLERPAEVAGRTGVRVPHVLRRTGARRLCPLPARRGLGMGFDDLKTMEASKFLVSVTTGR